MNVEKALEVLAEAASPNMNGEVLSSYYVIKEFIAIIKEEAGFNKVPVLLKKKE